MKKRQNWVDIELDRLYGVLSGLEPGTEDYNAVVTEMERLEAFAGKRKERKAFFDKPGRASIIGKVLGLTGVIGFSAMAYKAEKDGTMLFGKLGDVVTSIARTIFKWV